MLIPMSSFVSDLLFDARLLIFLSVSVLIILFHPSFCSRELCLFMISLALSDFHFVYMAMMIVELVTFKSGELLVHQCKCSPFAVSYIDFHYMMNSIRVYDNAKHRYTEVYLMTWLSLKLSEQKKRSIFGIAISRIIHVLCV